MSRGSKMEQRFGFIHDEMELKVLILYVLRKVNMPIPRNELTDLVLLCDDGIGYFEFAECLYDLIRTGHIREEDGAYALTQKGVENGMAAEQGIRYSVRIRADKASATTRQLLERDSMIHATHELRQLGGFTVKLSMGDGMGQLIDLELLCGDADQAKIIESNFRKHAEKLYGKIIDLLMNEV